MPVVLAPVFNKLDNSMDPQELKLGSGATRFQPEDVGSIDSHFRWFGKARCHGTGTVVAQPVSSDREV